MVTKRVNSSPSITTGIKTKKIVTNILMFLKPTQMIALAAWDAAFSKELTDSGTTGDVGSAGTS